MEHTAKQLTLKYAFLQSAYWITECAIYSFAAVFLHYKNFDNTELGIVLSLSSIFSILLQPPIAAYADKSKKISLRSIVLLLMIIVLASSLILLAAKDSFFIIAGVFVLINTIQFTLNPLLNSLAMEFMNKGVPINYGLARGTGSMAFAIASYFVGISVDQHGAGILVTVFIIGYCFLIAAAFLFRIKPSSVQALSDHSKPIDSKRNKTGTKEGEIPAPSGILGFFLKYKRFTLLLLGVAMIYYSHSLLNTYLISIIEHVGGNSADMGLGLTISAALELPTMAAFIYIIKKVECNNLIKISAFFFFIKALIAWLAPSVTILYVSQACQMLAFALFTPASVYYVNSIIDDRDKVKGQSMLGVASWGIAGTVANLTGGKILDTIGVTYLLLLGTIVSAIGFLVICFTTERRTL